MALKVLLLEGFGVDVSVTSDLPDRRTDVAFMFYDVIPEDREPEVDAVRKLVSERSVTVLISNHTYSNLVLRPPSIASTGLAPDEPTLKALGDAMASKNAYTSQAA